MLAPQQDIATIHPLRDLILAVQYTRPAMHGSLHIPEAYDKDGTWSWWECVKAGPDVERKLGIALAEGDIFRTPWRPAIDLGIEDTAGRRLFMVSCTVKVQREGKMVEDLNVTGIIFNDWED